jgi:hypothetical protein
MGKIFNHKNNRVPAAQTSIQRDEKQEVFRKYKTVKEDQKKWQ